MSTSPDQNWEPPSPGELQKLLPQYEITGILGRGGMGAVYRGRQGKLDRDVAVKVLPETFARGNDEMNSAARFLQEARAMAKLDHPAIISVYDFGETEEGQLYFVMEFVDGMDIHQYLHHHGGKLPQDQALAICAHVLDALDYAHSHGIVHRDIKPANILLNQEGRVKIADFGLAKGFGEGAADVSPALTMSNVAVGTPDFVAPEALEAGRTVDHRADLYAVGVMLYQLLTGRVPRGSFQMPSALMPELDPRIDEIVIKATAHDPDYRYPSASAIRADLDAIFSKPVERVEPGEDSSVVAAVVPVDTVVKGGKPASGGRYTPKPAESQRPTGLIIAGVGLAVVAVIGLVVMAMRSQTGNHETSSVSVAAVPASIKSSGETTPSDSRSEKAMPVAAPARPDSNVEGKKSPVVAGGAPVSTAPDPLPPGKWVKLFETDGDLPPGFQRQDFGASCGSWITAKNPGELLKLPKDLDGNYGVRVTLRLGESAKGNPCKIALRVREGNYHQAFLSASGKLGIQKRANGKYEGYPDLPEVADPMDPGTEMLLEFGAVGKRLIARVGTGAFYSLLDPELVEGTGHVAVDGGVRDIEVINLDGLPEVEALKILGVDEEGNDLRGATSTSITQAPAYPAGQWVKMFTRFEDLPEELRDPKAPRRVVWDDGWMKAADSGVEARFPLPGELLRDYAVRATFRMEGDQSHGIRLRGQPSDFKDGYQARRTGNLVFLQKRENSTYDTIGRAECENGTVFTLEFGAIGSKMVARSGRLKAVVADDSTYPSGDGEVYVNNGSVRDIEVLNLDGLPEVEALRLLGVEQPSSAKPAVESPAPEPAMPAETPALDLSTIPGFRTRAEGFLAARRSQIGDLNARYIRGIVTRLDQAADSGNLLLSKAYRDEKSRVETLAQELGAPQEDLMIGLAMRAVLSELPPDSPEALINLRRTWETERAKIREDLDGKLLQSLQALESELTKAREFKQAEAVNVWCEAQQAAVAGRSINSEVDIGAMNLPSSDTARTSFENSLGMKFVPVPGTDVLFCIHETRYGDYAEYAKRTTDTVDATWKVQRLDGFEVRRREDEHPVMQVSWEDAKKFCAWLSEKEGRIYRLPTDREWSVAVGVDGEENWKDNPIPKNVSKSATAFPWGGEWPPQKPVGNYSDESRHDKADNSRAVYMEGYDDGFPTTAPVMSFEANKFGIYDLGGNAFEWCEDWYSEDKTDRVLRGGSWAHGDRKSQLSSSRFQNDPDERIYAYGFRVVVEAGSLSNSGAR